LLMLLAAIILIALRVAWWWRTGNRGTLDGKLTVLVRSSDRTAEPLPVDQPGALPAKSGGAMFLQVQLKEPAFVYLLWLDAEGRAMPLYPWNNEELEVTDGDQPPPDRRPTKLILSPLLNRSWTFGNRGGMETVLLLARTTRLPEGTSVGGLLGSSPAP